MGLKQLGKNLVLKNGTIIDPHHKKTIHGDVWIKDGTIAGVGGFKAPKSSETVDCSGKVITHGFCDLHVHFREPGREDKETLQTGSLAAMAGGFTRVCVMPNTNPPLDSPESINFIREKAENCPIHIHPIGAVTKSQDGNDLTEMGLMHQEGAVAFSDDGLPIQDGAMMRIALEYATLVDVPIINHAEDVCLRAEGVMHEGRISTHLGLPGNPDLAESAMVHRDLELAEFTGARLHVPHVSSAKAVHHIREMKQKNKNVTAEVTPHHLFFNDDALTSFNTHLKVAPPIRTEEDRRALIQAVKEGTIDCIATDHAPHTIEDKETTFDLASFGMIGLESCFGAVHKVLMDQEGLQLEDVIALLTAKPRAIMGFDPDLFTLGRAAEINVIDADKEWTFEREHVRSRSINSPFYGEPLKGKVELTISCGMIFSN
ncbi:MAG: dihydroorotase [Candidatus Neomarinimicrobiota bacterium]|nr:dihydroorotase [Candidatus Neomarinimicrobiota bacterium]|tara:strand:+ start:27 stop:1316 length:1290 start_codon:yes stop_codon:yes gene_type:complete